MSLQTARPQADPLPELQPDASPARSPWTIIGTGAMGCLWGFYLRAAQQPVQLLERTDQKLDALNIESNLGTASADSSQRTILLIKESNQGRQQLDARCIRPSVQHNPLQRVILATKAQDARAAFTQFSPLFAANAAVVLLQNGIEAQQSIARDWPEMRLYALVTSEGAYRVAPFHIFHAGRGYNWIGPLTAKAAAHPLKQLPSCQWQTNIRPFLLGKLAVNAVINPLTVKYRCTNGALLREPYWSELVALTQEVETVIQALEPSLSTSLQERVKQVVIGTRANRSSSLQDIQRGKSTELAFLTGFILRTGQSLGLSLPLNRQLVETLGIDPEITGSGANPSRRASESNQSNP